MPTVHGEDCFCCSENTRISQDNRPSLSRFNYRIGTYGSIREYLFHQLNQTTELQNWTHRAPDDPAVALIEGAAILGDILTFYQEAYANEAYLRTAAWRESISDLVRSLGYRLSPAVGGNTTFAFEIKKDEAVKIPAGFPVKATLEDIAKPAEFETIKEITAYPWLNRFNLFKPLNDGDITHWTTEFYISSPEQLTDPVELKVGDRLLVGEAPSWFFVGGLGLTNAEIVIVDSIREQHGRKYYTIKGNLKRTTNIGHLTAYRLGRTFHHFGYNSPAKIVNASAQVTSSATITPASGTTLATTTTTSAIPYLNVPMSRPVYSSFNAFSDATVSPAISDTDFPIDSEIKDLAAGTSIIIQAPYTYPGTFMAYIVGQQLPLQTAVREIKEIRSTTMKWGGIDGTVSLISLNYGLGGDVGNGAYMQIADALFHETTSPMLTLKGGKTETSAANGNTLYFYGTETQADSLMSRRIMLDEPTDEPKIVTVTNVVTSPAVGTESFPQLYPLTLSESVQYGDYPNDEPTVKVFGNLADADEGRTQPEVSIGSGDATQVFQNFKLPKVPLTYHIVPENTPSETPEIVIYVDGREWKQVDSFFGRDRNEQVYIVREDADGASWVQFGDSKTGSRLTTGVNNVTAIYRLGDGAYGPLKQDTKVQASTKLKNLDKIGMPTDATGGAEPEDGENARNAAPGKVQSLGRIVSLKDFESEAAAIPGVASASAAWDLVDNVPSVVVTVLMETGRGTEITAVRKTLNAYNNERGAARHSVSVVQGKRQYVTARVEYALRPTYRADIVGPAIRLALGVNYGKATRYEDQTGLFSLRLRRFGVREYASTIEGWVQNVEGVLWTRVVAFQELLPPTDPVELAVFNEDDPETYQMPATSVLNPIVTCDGGHILSLYDKHLTLAPVKEVAA